MPTTTNYAFPYPASSDPVQVWSDMQNLAVAIDTALSATAKGPIVSLLQGTLQSIPNNANTAITYAATDVIDTHGYHDPVTNNTRVTPLIAGYYEVRVTYWSAGSNTLTFLETLVRKNGSGTAGVVGRLGGGGTNNSAAVATTGTMSVSATAIIDLNGTTDYVEHVVRQAQSTGTAAVNTNISGAFSSGMDVKFLRPL